MQVRLAVVAAVAFLSVVVPAGAAGAASTTVPADCTVAPGRFQLLYDPNHAQAVIITSPGVQCSATSKYTIVVTYTLKRWYGSATGWKPEEQYISKAWNMAYALNDPFDCKRSGALLSLTAVYKYLKKDVGLVATITYPGRTTALCSSAPVLP